MAADYASLPSGEGREVMVRVCSQCHSPEIAAGRNMDVLGWKGIVDQMANNGAQATEAEFDRITKYLAASFPVTTTPPLYNPVRADSVKPNPSSVPQTRGATGQIPSGKAMAEKPRRPRIKKRS